MDSDTLAAAAAAGGGVPVTGMMEGPSQSVLVELDFSIMPTRHWQGPMSRCFIHNLNS